MAGWTRTHRLLEAELTQRLQEGCQIDRREWLRLLEACRPEDQAAARSLLEDLRSIRPPIDVPYVEPAALDAIRDVRPGGARELEASLEPKDVFERIHGGWIGRCVGMTLGSPHDAARRRERRPLAPRGRDEMRRWFRRADAWPLDGYGGSGGTRHGKPVDAVEPHSVTNFALVSLHVLEQCGFEFDTLDVALAWLDLLPFALLTPAEAQVYLAMLSDDRFALDERNRPELQRIDWEEFVTGCSPFREWVGARQRADLHGFLAPALPEHAAETAWRDASVSHVRSGLYDAMLTAAATAAAFVHTDPYLIIDVGLSEIPAHSRLGAAVRRTLRLAGDARRWEDAWDAAMEEFGRYGPDHAIPNLLVVVLALLFGEGDFTRTLGFAVRGGLNHAQNAATAGAIAGVMTGRRGIPAQWATPLRNTLKTDIPGHTHSTLTDAATRTMRLLDTPR